MSHPEYNFDWVAAPAQMLLDQLMEKWTTWDKCRRWYKWLSIIQLFVAYCLLFVSGALFHAGVVLVGTGACCHATGVSMGKTRWFDVDSYGNKTYSHTEDKGEWCKCIANMAITAGFGCLVGCFASYCLSWLFLALSFISFYEEVDLLAPEEFFVLINKKQYPLEMNVYPRMDRKAAKIGTVGRTNIICGSKVYTGWIRLSSSDEAWIYCNRRGKMIFERFPTKEEAEFFCNQQMLAATTEVAGVPMISNTPINASGSDRRVYPLDTTAQLVERESIPVATVVDNETPV
jgi:hypothetical protein